MKLAKFTHKIKVFRKSKTQTATGFVNADFQLYGEFWANVLFQNGKETIKNAIVAENQVSVRLGLNELTKLISTDDLIQINMLGNVQTYEILSKQPDLSTMRYIDFVCKLGSLKGLENANG